MLRRRWPEVLETAKGLRRTTWILVSQNAQVQDLDATTLRLAFGSQGLVDRFRDHADVVARAVRETLGFDVHVQAVVAGGAGAGRPPAGSSAPATGAIPSAAQAAASWDAPAVSPSTGQPGPATRPAATTRPGRAAAGAPAASSSAPAPVPAEPDAGGGGDDDLDDDPIDPPDDEPPEEEDEAPAGEPEPDVPSPDDPLIEGSNLVGPPLVARLLGGTVIDEQVDDPMA